MRRSLFAILIPLVSTLGVGSFGMPDKRTELDSFAVKKIYTGTPASPKLVSKQQHLFRTMIRQGARSNVQFAGHYTVPIWGCGMACTEFVVADSITGRVYDGLLATDFPLAWIETHKGGPSERIEFRPDSRLLQVNGCPNEHHCGFYDYEMIDGVGLRLIRKELLPEKYQR
jgi:hypothetical protein